MAHRVYKMTVEAWERGTDWDTAICNGEIETVAEFDTLEDAVAYFETELSSDSERYGVE